MSRDEFFIHVSDTDKRLAVSRRTFVEGAPLSPCDMTPDDVDYEMEQGKHPEILEVCGMNQKSLEHFVSRCGKSYRFLSFFKCQMIKDFSPLEDLARLEQVRIYWNIGTDRLWNFSCNTALNTLRIADCKKITKHPMLLATSPTLETVSIRGDLFNRFPMDDLNVFGDMPNLRHLQLHYIRPLDKNMDFLSKAPKLERFDFDAGMLTTEEIAWIVAKYPHLQGVSLRAYDDEYIEAGEVRICGFRKPTLYLPEQQKRLDRYVARFDELVEMYRKESE